MGSMDTEQSNGLGLRERKKLELRQALSQAALRLAMERGPENVRIEDVTSMAGVSYRTFANYFSSREEAIVAVAVDRSAGIVQAFQDRPAAEPLAEALVQAFAAPHGETPQSAPDGEQNWLPRLRQVLATPLLSGAFLTARAASERALAAAIGRRTGTDPARDLYPRVLAAAVLGAEQAAVRFWLDTGSTASMPALVRQAIEQVVNAQPTTEGLPS
jgi:AcrR family transcriptional regulator